MFKDGKSFCWTCLYFGTKEVIFIMKLQVNVPYDKKTSVVVEVSRRADFIELRSLKIPVFGSNILPMFRCSQYVRLVGEQLFGKKFSISHAWDRRYSDKLVVSSEDVLPLKKFVESGTLSHGMLIGIYSPGSLFESCVDIRGERARYTHIGIYLGLNEYGEPILAEQYEGSFLFRSENELLRRGLRPMEIIDCSNI